MENELFDAVTRSVAARETRRALIGLVLGGGSAVVLADLAAARKKRKKKKKGCGNPGANCTSGNTCCSGVCCQNDCLDEGRICCTTFPNDVVHCADTHVCCDPNASNVGGCAPAGSPVCCQSLAGPRAWVEGTVCCDAPDDGVQGKCTQQNPVCCPDGCCPDGSTCATGGGCDTP